MNSKHSFMRYSLVLLMLIFSGIYSGLAQNWHWADKISGTLDNVSRGNVVDANGNVYVFAQIKGTVSVGTDVFITSGSTDALLVKFDTDGNYQWGLQLGGSDQETPTDITIDGANNIYVTGGFKGTTELNPASPGGTGELVNSNPDALNKNDIFLAKYTSAGIFVWAYQVSTGADNEFSRNITIDANDDILMVGDFKTEIIFNLTETVTATGSNQDIFAAKIDQAGSPTTVWHKHFPTALDNGKFLSVDATVNDNIYIGGYFEDKMYYDTDSCVSVGSTDLVLLKLDTNGNILWVRQGGGTALDQINTVVSDEYENVYFTGYYSTTANFDVASKGAYDSSPLVSKGGYDILLGKYNKTGNLQFVVGNGDSSHDNGYGLTIYRNFIEFSGYYSGTIIVNNDTLTSDLGNNDTGFLMYDTDGNPIEAHGMTGTLDDRGLSVVFDNTGSSFVTGYFQSDTLYVGSEILINATDDLSPKRKDVFIAKYDPPFSVTFSKIQNVLCNGESSGELIVTPYFGAPPFDYAWDQIPGLNDSTASNLTAGTYKVVVTDAFLNKDSLTIEITEPSAITITEVITYVLCHPDNGAGNDGLIDITVTGGTPAGSSPFYTYNWSGGTPTGPDNEDRMNLVAGQYYLTVIDENACEKKDTFDITQPNAISIDSYTVTTITVPPGSNGVVDITVSGGILPYEFDWDGPNSFTSVQEDISGLEYSGQYNLTITDDHSCTKDTNFFVPVDTGLVVYICTKQDVACFGESTGSAMVCVENGSGNYKYEWFNILNNPRGSDNPTLSGVPADTYYCRVTDNISLKTKDSNYAIIDEPAAQLALIFSKTNLTCYEDSSGAFDLTITGGTLPYSFDWIGPGGYSSTSEDISGLAAGNYSCIVTDANGCLISLLNEEITEPPAIVPDPQVLDEILCNGDNTGRIDGNATGGTGVLSYLWNDPAAQSSKFATNLFAGNYQVTVTDENGCQKISSPVKLSDPTEISITASIQDASCNGGSGAVIQTTSGGTPPYTYEWYKGTTYLTDTKNLTGQFAGDYTLKVFDANSCEKDSTFTISEPAILAATVDLTDVTCNGGNDGTITITLPTGGSGSYEYTVDGGTTWQASGNFGSLTAATYNVQIRDANATGCVITLDGTLVISEPAALIINHIDSDVNCNGNSDGSIDITPSGGTGSYTFTWSNGPTTEDISGLAPADYTVTVEDANACTLDSTFTISEPAALSIDSEVTTDITCNGLTDGTVTITASGGAGNLLYSIDGGITYIDNEGNFTGQSAGDYDVMIKDANDCEKAGSTITIIEPDQITIDLEESTDISCYGEDDGTITITASGGTGVLTYTLNPGTIQTNSTGAFTGLSSGTFTVDVDDANGCGPVTSDSIVVVEPDSLYIDSISVTNTFTGQSIGEIKVFALGGAGSLEFSIDNGDTYQSDSTFTGLSAGIYVIVVRDANGCTKTTQKEVEELSPIPEIYDAFTPNGDGVNDYWNIYYLDSNCIVKVYSTWGTLVFSSNGYPEPWDGRTRNGTELPAGTYIYVIDLGDGLDTMTGTVNIIK